MGQRRCEMNFSKCSFLVKGDHRGSLIALEAEKSVPFEIKRVYYIFDTKPGVYRGKHAHYNLQQILICMQGSCKILLDDGEQKEVFILDQPDQGLYVRDLIWREMYDFSEDCVLLVLASDFYHEEDYIRDYDLFLHKIRENKQKTTRNGNETLL